jgi:hypothetical protein
VAARSRADVERFALIIGNDQGAPHEQALRYAEADAERVYAVLRDVGGFAPANMALLKGEDADTVRSSLITFNDRIRQRAARPGQSLLLVYYSGHADAHSIHLRGTSLLFDELAKLVRGSSADLRLMMVDACHSGVLTRVKGGRPVPPFALPIDRTQLGEGFALLTASAANEDAQESDELGASFFTHALVSGLRGAADQNGDGRVLLDEVYHYAYAATLRASSRSAHGTQHPTFQYEVRGREALVLAMLEAQPASQARLRLPGSAGFLLLKGSANGEVVAEVPERGAARILTLPSGRYFVRGRAADYLLEGSIELSPGSSQTLDTRQLSKVEYARLVRKGGSELQLAHGPFAAATVRSAISGATRACAGAALGYAFHLRRVSVSPRVDACRSGFSNAAVEAVTNEYALGVAVLYVRDLARASLSAGGALSAQLSHQHFATQGRAPARLSVAPSAALVTQLGFDLGRGVQAGVEARGEAYALRSAGSEDASETWTAAFALRGSLMLGKLF